MKTSPGTSSVQPSWRLSRKARKKYGRSLVLLTCVLCGIACYKLYTAPVLGSEPWESSSRQLLNAVEVIPGFAGNKCDSSFEEAAGGALASIIYIIISVYLFLGIAVICDGAFVNSLEMICSPFGLDLSGDVAGATFMAAGSSAPELATSFIGVFLSDSDVGIGTILGSAVFNILIIIGATAILSGRTLQLDPRPVVRDNFFYLGSVLILVGCIVFDEEVNWYDNVMLLVWYISYVIFLAFNEAFMAKYFPDDQYLPKDEQEPEEATSKQNPLSEEDPQDSPEAGAIAALAGASVVLDESEPVKSLEFHDYNVNDDGIPETVTDPNQKGQFRCAGDSFMEFGFQLTNNPNAPNQEQQQGHFMCLVEFEAAGSQITLKFEYNMFGSPVSDGAGLCAYILDPSVPGWDSEFDGTGPMGFLNKTGAILGVAFDNTGVFTGGDEYADHVTIKGATQPSGQHLKTKKVEGGFMTGEDDWRHVDINFDIEDMNCDVKLDDVKILDDIEFGDIKIPPKLCVAVCGAASNSAYMIAVNDVQLVDEDDIQDADAGSHEATGAGAGTGTEGNPPPQMGNSPQHTDPPSAPATETEMVSVKLEGGEEKEGDGTEGEDEEDEEDSCLDKFVDICSLPYELAFQYTIPDCQYEDIDELQEEWPNLSEEEIAQKKAELSCGQRWFWASFFISLVWITILSYFMVELMLKLGCLWSIPDVVMGLTFLAMGTSIPDALGSISVAKDGQGDMAVSNAVGSNVFDICIGLGLPWFIKSCSDDFSSIKICDTSDVIPSIFILLGIIAVLFGVLWYGKWKLVPQSGYVLFAAYAAFIIYSLVKTAVHKGKTCD